MGRNKTSIIILIIVGLAVIGLVSSLIKDPSGFLISILVMVGIALVIFMIMRMVLNRRVGGTSDEMKKYKQAVKQSKSKYKKDQPVIKKRSSANTVKPRIKKRRRQGPHLTVIEGKKGKKRTDNNDRASN